MGNEKKLKRNQNAWEPFSTSVELSEEDSAKDFEMLLLNSALKGSNFQFKEEKKWKNDSLLVNPFQLNLPNLADSLSSVVFYERQNISSDLFSENELKRMQSDVKTLSEDSKIDDYFPDNLIKQSEISEENICQNEGLADISTQSNREKSDNIETNDLEDWLDTVLDQ